MKSYHICLLVVMSCLSSDYVCADSGINQVATIHAARTLSRIKNPDDFEKVFPTTSRFRKQVEMELAGRDVSQFSRPVITMPTMTTVELKFPERVVGLDYGQIEKHVLLVNGKAIKLEAYKTFLNYKSEVMAILSQKKFALSVSLIPEAEAANLVTRALDWIEYYTSIANAHAFVYNLSDSRDGNLAASIIRAYQNELDFSKGEAEKSRSAVLTHYPVTFNCSDGHILTMQQSTFSTNGRSQSIEKMVLGAVLAKTSSGFTYRSNLGVVEMDQTYKVTNSSNSLVGVGSDFSMQAPYFKFPQIAERCCAQSGCYQEVSRAFNSQLREAVKFQKTNKVQ